MLYKLRPFTPAEKPVGPVLFYSLRKLPPTPRSLTPTRWEWCSPDPKLPLILTHSFLNTKWIPIPNILKGIRKHKPCLFYTFYRKNHLWSWEEPEIV